MRSPLLVMIPALNEADSIAAVVADARANLAPVDVVVVDDGSTDETGRLAAAAGATVLTLPYNLGVGGAIRTALRYAQREGYPRVLQLDGDGQHLASEGARLVRELDDGVDLVVGSRFASGYEVSGGRRLVMRILSRTISRRLRTKVSDTTSGFRAMSSRTIDTFARQYPLDYLSDTVEALLIAGDAHLVVREVDVRMRPRQGGVPSASPFKSAYHLVRLLLVVVVHMIRRRPTAKSEEPLV